MTTPQVISAAADERRRLATEDDIDLGWLWNTLVRRWRLLLVTIVVGTSITAALVLMSPPRYEAVATLVVRGSAASPSANANAVRNVLTASAVRGSVNATLDSEQFRISLDTGSIHVDPVVGTTLVRLRVQAIDAAAAARAAALLAERGAAAARDMREKALTTARPALDVDVEAAAKRLEGLEQRLLEFRRQSRIEVPRVTGRASAGDEAYSRHHRSGSPGRAVSASVRAQTARASRKDCGAGVRGAAASPPAVGRSAGRTARRACRRHD